MAWWTRDKFMFIVVIAIGTYIIPDGVIGIFHWRTRNPSDRTMVLGLTQPLTEMSTRNISWGVKAAGA
jgi:hypothetical protein